MGEAGAPDPTHPHVWVLDATEPWFDALADAGVVSDEERARAVSLSDAAAVRTFMARRSALRMVLGRYVGQQPKAIRIATASEGKPVLVPTGSPLPTFAFSTSHSGDLYCIAVGVAASVGVDVERSRPVPRARSIAARWFGAAEALDEVADEELGTEFMRLWTAKEALAKCHGAGLRLLRGQEGELDVAAASAEGRLHFFSPGPGYAGAIASTEFVEGVEVIRPGDDLWTR
jgi:4'-phosphopantetheinyl transferase